ncbi:MAG: hypothetical protein Q8Q09_23845 [Deltaproteobacteria bacterium]|nr:hypothetical protein [Deltaproteobacteria bacterium]
MRFLNDLLKNFPSYTKGHFETTSINDEVMVYSGPMELIGGTSISGSGTVALAWEPYPRMQFKLDGPLKGEFSNLSASELQFPRHSRSGQVMVSSRSLGEGDNSRTTGVIYSDIEFGDGSQLSEVRFHVANFHDSVGIAVTDGQSTWAGRHELSHKGWTVTIDKVPHFKELFAQLRTGGYGITHVGVIRRSDGSAFRSQDVSDVLKALDVTLTFSRGLWCPVVLPVGHDQNNERCWYRWTSLHVGRVSPIISWFPEVDRSSLTKLFPGVLDRVSSSRWRDPLGVALHWYIEAVGARSGAEASIVYAQTALEVISSVLLVDELNLHTDQKLDALKAYDRLSQLMNSVGLPNNIPQSLRSLRADVSAGKLDKHKTASSTISGIRNKIIHPTASNRMALARLSSTTVIEAMSLSIWHVEMVLLWLFKYSGVYSNRLRERSIMDNDNVPWRV